MLSYIRKISLITALLLCTVDNLYAEIAKYPYRVSKDRALEIKQKFIQIKIGMNQANVEKILGKPDEILERYEPIVKNGKKIGLTYLYIIQRLSKNGSVNQKGEKLVRISFDLKGEVTKVDSWGLTA